VRIWDALTGAELKVLIGHTESVRSVAFSSDGTRIVSGSSNMSVRVWDASTGAELKVLHGHTKIVSSVSFSSDDMHIVSGSHDNSVRVWDALTEADSKPVVPNFNTHSVNSITSPTDSTFITLDEESAQLSVVDRTYPGWTNTGSFRSLAVIG